MKKTKKLVALSLAAAMVMSSSAVAFAAQHTESPVTGSSVGTGGTEGYVDKNVFTVDVTTDQTISFKLDPQELLLATGSSKTVDGAALAEGYGSDILFEDATGNFTTESEDYTVVNMSTMPVSVTANAKITGLTSPASTAAADAYDVKVVEDVADETATAISMKLAPTTGTMKGTDFTTGEAVTPTFLTDATAGAVVTNTVAAIEDLDAAYEVTGTTGSYKYELKADTTAVTFDAVTFNLSGEVNTEADWTNFDKASAQLQVEVVYTIEKSSCFAFDDGYAVYIALSPFDAATGTAPNPGFEGAQASDITNLTINGKSVTPVIVEGYISLAYSVFTTPTPLTPPYVITFTYNGASYSVTLTE